MSTATFPTLPGIAFPVVRTNIWSSDIQSSVSGREVRLGYYTTPRYSWKLDVSVLRSIASPQDFQALMGFVNARSGGFDSFLYADPDDSTVTAQYIGTGNGTQTAFQLVRTLGGFVEPVLAYNVISNLYLSGAIVPASGINSPTPPVLSYIAGGSLGAATYYVRATYISASGETATSIESSLAVPANNLLVVAAPAAETGAVGWNVYVSTSTATETRQNGTTIPIGNSWSESTSGLIHTGPSFPLANTTGFSVSPWGSANPGIITFAGAPANTVAITADFSYYWPCRFLSDKTEFSLDFQGLYSVKALTWQSVKN